MNDAPIPRWLILVRDDKRELYHDLQQTFTTDRQVAVVLDRRGTERRAGSRSVGMDRRRRERRRSTIGRTLDLWKTAGLRLAEEMPPDMKWEYRFEEIHPRETARINRLGDDGWDAVSAMMAHGGELKCLVLFKRRKADPASGQKP